MAYKGIPFAAPPMGELRWRAPQPVKPWPHALEAKAFKADCVQEPFPGGAAPLGTVPAGDCLGISRNGDPNGEGLPQWPCCAQARE